MAELPTSTSECPRSTPSTVITAYNGTSQRSPRWDLAANAWASAPQASTNSIPVIQDNPRNLKRKSVINEDEPAEVSQPKKIKENEKVTENQQVNNNTEENPHIKSYTPEAVNDPSSSIKSGKTSSKTRKTIIEFLRRFEKSFE